MNSQPHESNAKQSGQYYAWISIQAEDGDQDGDWSKGDEISMEDKTTKDEDIIIDDQTDKIKVYSCVCLSLFSYGYILADIYFFEIKRDVKHNVQCIKHSCS